MSKRILIVDDEPELVALLEMGLGGEGYSVSSATTGQGAIAKLQSDMPDLILMDVMLPDISGVRLTGQIKNNSRTAGIPIIMLTAKDSATDVIVGLNMGADDYVTKPFSMSVLAARIDAVLRRKTSSASSRDGELICGDVAVRPESRQCFVNGRSIDLAPAEFRILVSLMEACGNIVKLEDIATVLGLAPGENAGRNIYVHVSSLRRKLGPARKIVKTVQGLGYRIET
ncbi:MAG TPA: response regulator transcription factor, partial [Sedimentisphaerales bacterium]|nr:response regulator transcription factor [Sedimentisphaerales bacterium]